MWCWQYLIIVSRLSSIVYAPIAILLVAAAHRLLRNFLVTFGIACFALFRWTRRSGFAESTFQLANYRRWLRLYTARVVFAAHRRGRLILAQVHVGVGSVRQVYPQGFLVNLFCHSKSKWFGFFYWARARINLYVDVM